MTEKLTKDLHNKIKCHLAKYNTPIFTRVSIRLSFLIELRLLSIDELVEINGRFTDSKETVSHNKIRMVAIVGWGKLSNFISNPLEDATINNYFYKNMYDTYCWFMLDTISGKEFPYPIEYPITNLSNFPIKIIDGLSIGGERSKMYTLTLDEDNSLYGIKISYPTNMNESPRDTYLKFSNSDWLNGY